MNFLAKYLIVHPRLGGHILGPEQEQRLYLAQDRRKNLHPTPTCCHVGRTESVLAVNFDQPFSGSSFESIWGCMLSGVG